MMTHFIEISYTFVTTAVSADQRGVLRTVRDLLPGEVMLMMMMIMMMIVMMMMMMMMMIVMMVMIMS